jgi:hypothetical protein
MEKRMHDIDDGFRIDTPEKAAWAMRKYRVLAQQKARSEALAAAEHARIDAWLARSNASVEQRMDYFKAHLDVYGMKERLAGRKSVDLPDGVIKTRTSAPSFEVDKSVFLEWATEQKRDDLLRVTFAPDMAAIKGSLVADSGQAIDPLSGEVVPGLLAISESVSVTITPDLDAIDLEGIEGVEDEFE